MVIPYVERLGRVLRVLLDSYTEEPSMVVLERALGEMGVRGGVRGIERYYRTAVMTYGDRLSTVKDALAARYKQVLDAPQSIASLPQGMEEEALFLGGFAEGLDLDILGLRALGVSNLAVAEALIMGTDPHAAAQRATATVVAPSGGSASSKSPSKARAVASPKAPSAPSLNITRYAPTRAFGAIVPDQEIAILRDMLAEKLLTEPDLGLVADGIADGGLAARRAAAGVSAVPVPDPPAAEDAGSGGGNGGPGAGEDGSGGGDPSGAGEAGDDTGGDDGDGGGAGSKRTAGERSDDGGDTPPSKRPKRNRRSSSRKG